MKMYLHLGKGYLIPLKEIVYIGPMVSVSYKNKNKKMIDQMQSEKKIINIAGEKPQSLILTTSKAYFSIISAATLKKRLQKNFSLQEQ